MDKISKDARSRNMAAIRSKNTKPEITVRKILFNLGYRYRIHKKDLPGKPDIVLKKYKTIIFVNGCFWHYHKGCKRASIPKSNIDYWKSKIKKNIKRDKKNIKTLKNLGWNILIIWECQTKNTNKLKRIIIKFLNKKRTNNG